MAIKSNDSTTAVVGSGLTYYSGISNFKVVAVNPTLSELHDIGVKYKTEPTYNVNFGGEDFTKIVFWLKNDDLTTSLEILMNSNLRISQNDKPQWMNSIGQTTFSDVAPMENPNLTWWKEAGTHKAIKGEEKLIAFTQAWANVASGDEVVYDTLAKIAKGDVAELNAVVKLLENNEVRLLVGVRTSDQGKAFQKVYDKFFGRVSPAKDEYFVRKLNDTKYGAFDADYNADLQWGPYTPELVSVTPDPAPVLSLDEGEDWN